MKSLFLAGLSLVSARKHTELEGYTYDQWVAEYNPVHRGNSSVFEANLASIRKHNSDPTFTWKQGVNKFTGMTAGERRGPIVFQLLALGCPTTPPPSHTST
jgi:hypothetical protein